MNDSHYPRYTSHASPHAAKLSNRISAVLSSGAKRPTENKLCCFFCVSTLYKCFTGNSLASQGGVGAARASVFQHLNWRALV